MIQRLEVRVPAESVAGAQAVLEERGDPRWSIFEDVVKRRAALSGIFRNRAEAMESWRSLNLPGLPTIRVLAKADWADSYKRHFKRWRFGRLHWVPVWEKKKFRLPRGHKVLWLDPGMAFGTGNHETTRLCVERLAALARQFPALGSRFLGTSRSKELGTRNRRRSLLDAGCGSGILALSGALLGFKPAAGFDNDPVAVDTSRKNAKVNGLSPKVHFFVADVAKGCRGRKADVVVANIQADVLMANATRLLRAVAPGGSLILSGILTEEIDAVRAAFARKARGCRMESTRIGEWSDLMLRRPLVLKHFSSPVRQI